MEEVDNIIIHSLRKIGCDIGENIINLSEFSTELVLEATIKCLEVIRFSSISKDVPMNTAARFRLGGNLAQACVELGYRGDIGYQTFLYCSDTDLRRLFIFLIEKIPKDNGESDKPISNFDVLRKSVGVILSNQLDMAWLPHYSRKKYGGCIKMSYKSVLLELNDNHTNHQLSERNRINCYKYFLPSIISYNILKLYASFDIAGYLKWLSYLILINKNFSNEPVYRTKNIELINRFLLHKKFEEYSRYNENHSSSDHLQNDAKTLSIAPKILLPNIPGAEHKSEIEQLKTDSEQLRTNVAYYQKEIKKLAMQIHQYTIQQSEERMELTSSEKYKQIKAKVREFFVDSQNNTMKLETIVETEKIKLINLATRWEHHRVQLIEKYRDEREKYSDKASTSRKKLDEYRSLREKERGLSSEHQMKDQHYTQLLIEVQKQPKEINRSAYTKRILEIINNVRKQKDEIDNVLKDTRDIQKEINTLSGKLERSFTVVDELIFRDAKFSEAARKAYKLLATLHSDCNELVILVEETGTTLREIRDLEEQIESESSKNIEANLQRITADLEQMRRETALLVAQLASKST